MPRDSNEPIPLHRLVLPDARTGHAMDLGALRGAYLLTAIRHRF